jgi:DNA-binding transcriptional LysR family regulator
VSRHIEALEEAVGGTLFVRSQRGLSPTDRAIALQPYAEELVAASAALLRTASGGADEVAGTVRITASEIVAVEHLPAILAEVRRRHPKLSVELILSNAVDDLLQRRADIAVRMIEPRQQALVAKRVGAVTLGLHARREYLDRRGIPGSLDELAQYDMIGPDTETPGTRAVLALLPGITRGDFAMKTDSDLGQLAAIRAGLGIGVCQAEVARRDPRLVRILHDVFSVELPLWIVVHEDLRSSARCRVVFDALADGLSTFTEQEMRA